MCTKKYIDMEINICRTSSRLRAYGLYTSNNTNNAKLYAGRVGYTRICIDAIVDRTKTIDKSPVFYINENTRPYLRTVMSIVMKDINIEHDDTISNTTWEQLLDNAVKYKKGIQFIPFSDDNYRTLFIRNDNSMTVIKNKQEERFIVRLINAKSSKINSKIERIFEEYIVYHYSGNTPIIDLKSNDETDYIKKYINKNTIDKNIYPGKKRYSKHNQYYEKSVIIKLNII